MKYTYSEIHEKEEAEYEVLKLKNKTKQIKQNKNINNILGGTTK